MRVVTAAEIDAALTPAALADALADAFRGALTAPKRHHHTIPRPAQDATLLLMPAWSHPRAGQAVMGVKVVTVFSGKRRARPALGARQLHLMDGETGAPLAVIDGARSPCGAPPPPRHSPRVILRGKDAPGC